MTRTRILVIAAILVPLLSLALWAFLIEPNRLVINEQTIHLANWPSSIDGLRIAAISDIHAGSPFMDEEKLRDIVALTNQTNPDLIVLLGDFMVRDTWHSTTIEPEVIAEALKGFQSRMGIYAVLGNHDHWYDASRVRAALEKSGIKVLENDVAKLEKNRQTIWLIGLADAWTGRDDIAGTSRRVVAEQPVITLTHNPDIFPRLPSIFDLTVAGHTHGGQVNLPFLGRRVVPSEFGQRYAAGHILEDGKYLFVTTGIGTSVFPIRFRVPPEIAVLTIKAG